MLLIEWVASGRLNKTVEFAFAVYKTISKCLCYVFDLIVYHSLILHFDVLLPSQFLIVIYLDQELVKYTSLLELYIKFIS